MKKLFRIFTRKSEGSKYMPPEQEVQPTCLEHHVLLILLEHYPEKVSVLELQYKTKSVTIGTIPSRLRAKLKEMSNSADNPIQNTQEAHINQYGNISNKSFYMLRAPFYRYAVELEKSYRKEGKDD